MNLRAPNDAAAVCGVFSDYRLVKTRSTLQIIVEIPIEGQADAFRALGYPMPGADIHVAVARLNSPAGALHHSSQSINRKEVTIAAEPDGMRSPKPNAPAGETCKGKRSWDELRPSQQAGILCGDKAFQKFASTHTGWACDEDDAAAWLRAELDVTSRKELDLRPDLKPKLNHLRAEFMQWAGRVPEGR